MLKISKKYRRNYHRIIVAYKFLSTKFPTVATIDQKIVKNR